MEGSVVKTLLEVLFTNVLPIFLLILPFIEVFLIWDSEPVENDWNGLDGIQWK